MAQGPQDVSAAPCARLVFYLYVHACLSGSRLNHHQPLTTTSKTKQNPPTINSIGPKGELAGALDEDRMEKMIDELEKATGGAFFPLFFWMWMSVWVGGWWVGGVVKAQSAC